MSIDAVQAFVYSCDDCKGEERVERRGHLSAERPWAPLPEGWTSQTRLRASYKNWFAEHEEMPGPHAYYNHHCCPKCSTAC